MRSDATRNHEAILSAAISVLVSEPGASMRQIAEASGTGRTTLYRHFPDREALVEAIFDRVHAEADATIARALRDPEAAADPVRTIAELAVELVSFGDRYRFLDRHAESPSADERVAMADSRARTLAFVNAGQAAGRVRADLGAEWLVDAMAAIVTRVANRDHADVAQRAESLRRTIRSLFAPVG